jgi:hypothetical protein
VIVLGASDRCLPQRHRMVRFWFAMGLLPEDRITMKRLNADVRRRDRRRMRPTLTMLEERVVLSAAFPEFVDPDPAPGNQFGATVVPLRSGNVVITAPGDDAGGINAGAVYLFNGATGALISTLTGSAAGDAIGNRGVTALTNGNYVVESPNWSNGVVANAGAVTFGSGTNGISGAVSSANSLVGSSTNDHVGSGNAGFNINGVTALTNGNYVVDSPNWASGAGAVTFGSGTAGVFGAVSSTNSLVGSMAGDAIGDDGVTILTTGNYVVPSPNWSDGGVPRPALRPSAAAPMVSAARSAPPTASSAPRPLTGSAATA